MELITPRDTRYGLCKCGCNKKTSLSLYTCIRDGYVKGEPRPYLHGHSTRGMKHTMDSVAIIRERSKVGPLEKSPRWKGGVIKTCGYVAIKMHGHPHADQNGYVKRAVLVMEEKLGFSFSTDFTVHHKNEVKDDDHPDNLELMTRYDHRSYHSKLIIERRAVHSWT